MTANIVYNFRIAGRVTPPAHLRARVPHCYGDCWSRNTTRVLLGGGRQHTIVQEPVDGGETEELEKYGDEQQLKYWLESHHR